MARNGKRTGGVLRRRPPRPVYLHRKEVHLTLVQRSDRPGEWIETERVEHVHPYDPAEDRDLRPSKIAAPWKRRDTLDARREGAAEARQSENRRQALARVAERNGRIRSYWSAHPGLTGPQLHRLLDSRTPAAAALRRELLGSEDRNRVPSLRTLQSLNPNPKRGRAT